MTIGEAIRKARISEGMTQKMLSIMSGVSLSHIRRLEHDKRKPKLTTLKQLAKAMNRNYNVKYTVNSDSLTALFTLPENPRSPSFDQLVTSKQMYGRLFKDCMRLCSFNRAQASDLAQETILQAIEHANRYNPEKGQIYTWLFEIAKSIRLREIRDSKHLMYIENYIDTGSVATPEDVKVPITAFEYIERLPKRRREMIRMNVLNYTHDQIATELGYSRKYVKNRVCQIRKDIERLVQTN